MRMRKVIVSAKVHDIIRAQVTPGYELEQPGRRLPDGSWEIELDALTLDRIESLALPGETVSDAIERAFATLKGLN